MSERGKTRQEKIIAEFQLAFKKVEGILHNQLKKRELNLFLREIKLYLRFKAMFGGFSWDEFERMLEKGKVKELCNGIMRYKQAREKGIKCFTQVDSDGIERDYYRFPSTMSIEERMSYLPKLTLLSSRSFFASGIFGRKLPKIPYGSSLKAIKRGPKDLTERDQWICSRYDELRKDGIKPAGAGYSKIASELKTKSFGNWGGYSLSEETIKKIIYGREGEKKN